MSCHVTLSTREMIQAAFVGIMRQVDNLHHGRQDAHGAPRISGWQMHIEGAMGEMAVAKMLGKFWTGAHTLGECDVQELEVRTRSMAWYELIVHNEDRDDARFVLVTGVNGRYTVHGWIRGIEGKMAKWWKDPAGGRPAYFVPQRELHPMDEKVGFR